MNLYFLNFNNYYNRIIKVKNSAQEYEPYLAGDPVYNVINFNFGDGLTTEYTLNAFNFDQEPDYLVVFDDQYNINSRWFVIESNYLRNGQYTLLLKRDVVADNYEQAILSPCFIEKATVNQDDPAIYNNENMGFNQILNSVSLLKDETNVPWVVGYVPRNFPEDTERLTVTAPLVQAGDVYETIPSIEEWEFGQYVNYTGGVVAYPKEVNYKILCNNTTSVTTLGDRNGYLLDAIYDGLTGKGTVPEIQYFQLKGAMPTEYAGLTTANNSFITEVPTAGLNASTIAYTTSAVRAQLNNLREVVNFSNNIYLEEQLRALDGKIIYDESTQRYLKIVFHANEQSSGGYQRMPYQGELFNFFYDNWVNSSHFNKSYNESNPSLFYSYTANYIYITLEQTFAQVTTTISKERYLLEDQPYDMFCIPAGSLDIYDNGAYSMTTNGAAAIAIGQAVGAQLGSSAIFDVQLVPYCPVRDVYLRNGRFDVQGANYDLITVQGTDTPISAVFWATKSSFSFTINQGISIDDYKISNECDLYRLCSPNYNGQFEFSPAKNKGVDYFKVDCSYKPYQPYIHIAPNWKGLYLSASGESASKLPRGLICGGDFSLPQMSDAWVNYQLNNKNYEVSFQRQIESMDVSNNIQRESEQIALRLNTASALLGGGASGALAGAQLGGAIGAGIGAVAGGAINAGITYWAGQKDIEFSERLRTEALDYTKDQFDYQLGNIKAMPQGLTKVSSYNPNNLIFPFLEVYTCTAEERWALINKIYYNGMTVMRISNIASFLREEPSYIKGKLIKCENFKGSFKELKELSEEIYKGVFI